jgi:hypothetical protein
MPKITTPPVVAPTTAQYEALVAPPPERFSPSQLVDFQCSRWEPNTAQIIETLRPLAPQDGKLFILVPPKPVLTTKAKLDALVATLTYRGKRGVNYNDPEYLKDEIAVPEGPYLLTEVEDGRASLGIASCNATAHLAPVSLSPLTWWEVFCLYRCFGSMILGHHNVWCSGSRYGSRVVPCFYFGDGRSWFDSGWDAYANPEWGSAACGRRVGT